MTDEDRKIIVGLIDYCRSKAEDCRQEEFADGDEDEWNERERVLAQILVDRSELVCGHCAPRLPLRLKYAVNDVPWERKGCLGGVSKDDTPWRNDVANVSVSRNRLLYNSQMIECRGGMAERAFAAMWDFEHNKPYGSGGILFKILGEEPVHSLLRDEADIWLSQLVAQAVIQWLGTNCGMGFIKNAESISKIMETEMEREREFLRKLADCPTGQVPLLQPV